MSSKRATTGGTKQARENARQAAINLIPPAQLQAAEAFGEAASTYAATLTQLREHEDALRAATDQARKSGWNQAQLRQLLEQLDLAEISLPKRSTRSDAASTPPTTATNAPQPSPEPGTTSPETVGDPASMNTH